MMKYVRLTALPLAALAIAIGCTPSEPPKPTSPPAPATAPEPKAQPVPGKQVTIYRDKWGVPHIFADTDAAAAFGLGYAQAEDRLPDIYANARLAVGRAAEVEGEDAVRTDFAMRLVQNEEIARKSYGEASDYLRELADSYVAGVNAYVARHPERKPADALEFEPWHCSAIGRAMILRWPLGGVFGDLGKKDKRTPVGRSNEWAISPKRTATGGAILLTDPHVGWEGIQVFYEARV
ncbi:MAG: penicillin acylase family protein, partial [Candidatus Hydrogenedentes bacterium]|nr:penicillin acylase family protein [Candidatus Hydrogenedentota bacterium]